MAPKAKPKPSPVSAPQSQTTVDISDLYSSINRHIQRSEYQHVIKLADQIIAISPNDEDAVRCKVVALIKADEIDRALSAIESFRKLKIDFSFLKAYCLYRKNKLDEALDLLKAQDGNSAAMLLQSQILFRSGKMDASLDIYQKFQKSEIESLEINLVAGMVSAGKGYGVQGALDSLGVKATSSFELAYNTACSYIQTEQYSNAEQLLLSARRIGQETLMEESLADDDIEIELAPIAVQLAYIQQLLGHTQEAIGAYTEIIKRNLADETSLAVSTNNLVSAKGPKDISDSLRKLDRWIEKGRGPHSFQLAHGLDLKLSSKQKEAIYCNRALLLLHSNKIDQARELVAALPDMFPATVMPVLLQAAVFVKENKAAKAEEILGQYSDNSPAKSKPILLARAQIAASAGHPQVAADSLLKMPDIQHMPATVATLIALKERSSDIEGAITVFDYAIKWWSNSMTGDDKLNLIMQEAASFKLKHGKKEEAAKLYEQLVKSHGSIEALVGLIKTSAHSDIDKAESYEKKLKPLPGLKSVDVDSLEKTSGAKHVETGLSVGTGEQDENKNKEKTKKKRKRKPRYPKGFDVANPGPPPDPERWLPRRERSSYRPKRKDKRAAQVRGSQGAVAKEATNSNAKSNQTSSGKTEVEQQHKPSTSKSSRKKSRK